MEITMVRRRSAAPDPQSYSSKIIKAGALLGDTKTLLAHWDTSASVTENLDRLRRENVFGKSSRSRVEDILAVFRQRYLEEPEVTRALVLLAQRQLPAASLDRVLYYHAALSDRLLHDVVTEILVPMAAEGLRDVHPNDIQKRLGEWVAAGLTTASWSEGTILRVTQGLLSTLRDFGVLRGAVNKRIGPAYMPVRAFAHVAFHLKQRQPSGERLLEHPDWRLFFMDRNAVELGLVEANQHGLLEYHAAGSVTRLTFPADTLEGYADVLTQKPH